MHTAFSSWLEFRRKLRILDAMKETLFRSSRTALAEVDNENKEEVRSLEGYYAEKFAHIQDEQDEIADRQLINKALRLGVPIPTRPRGDEDGPPTCREGDYWRNSHADPYEVRLSREGEKYLRDEIRSEKKERRDYYLGWLPLITALSGFISALTALVAVWLSLSGH